MLIEKYNKKTIFFVLYRFLPYEVGGGGGAKLKVFFLKRIPFKESLKKVFLLTPMREGCILYKDLLNIYFSS